LGAATDDGVVARRDNASDGDVEVLPMFPLPESPWWVPLSAPIARSGELFR